MTMVDFGSHRPFSNWCDCCERDNSAMLVIERERYECDACRRDIESEAEELQQAAE